MRHLVIGRKLGVNASHRKAMLRSLTLALIEYERIKTTPARAKELRWYADHVITLAKRGDLASRRQLIQLLGHTATNRPGENRVRMAIDRIYTDLVPRFKDRTGGYTQLIRLVPRRAGDNAEMCLFQYLPAPDDKKGKEKGKKDKKAAFKQKLKAKSAEDRAEDKAEKKDKPSKSKKKDKVG